MATQALSIGDKLERRKGIGPGFDFLRVGLASCVVAWHSFAVVGNNTLDHRPFVWFPGYGVLVMFFSLSGFLISGSALRLKLRDFLINRGLRILPALAVEVILSAMILGPIFTTLALTDYFTQGQTYKYFTNIVGFINYQLPGVFKSNPGPSVNYALWTIPYEFGCYAVMSAFVIIGALKNRAMVLVVAILYGAICLALSLTGVDDREDIIGGVVRRLFTARGSRLYMAFVLGVAVYLYRHAIPYSKALVGVCLAGCALIAAIRPAEWMSYPLLNIVVAPMLTYIMAFIGVSDIPRLPFFHRGDYSYGIYLYGVPLQQAFVAMFPTVMNPALQLLMAFPCIVAFAVFSWHAIEKPILGLRKNFSFVAKVRGVEGAPPPETVGRRSAS
jgi:peptidoglycan/LPS O-acetylase OafA/YrhL